MPSILDKKDTIAPSVFRPAALLRDARRQKGLTTVDVPAVCILDPDGDIVRRLRQDGRSQPFDGWPCYHTRLDTFSLAGRTVGIVGCAVGAPFAVLIAEELFASGCRLLLSLTSAGQITPPYAMKGPAITTRRRLNTPAPIQSLSQWPRRRYVAAKKLSSAQAGQPMRLFAKLPTRSRRPGRKVSSRSRWRLPLSTLLPA